MGVGIRRTQSEDFVLPPLPAIPIPPPTLNTQVAITTYYPKHQTHHLAHRLPLIARPPAVVFRLPPPVFGLYTGSIPPAIRIRYNPSWFDIGQHRQRRSQGLLLASPAPLPSAAEHQNSSTASPSTSTPTPTTSASTPASTTSSPDYRQTEAYHNLQRLLQSLQPLPPQ